MPRLWNVFSKMSSLLKVKQLSQADMGKIVRRFLMQLKGKPSKKALAVSPQIRERLTSLLKQIRGCQLASSAGRIMYQYQPRLTFVKVGRQYKLAKKFAVTGAALLLFLSAGTQAEAQQEVNAGGFRVQFWDRANGDANVLNRTISQTDLGTWSDEERQAVVRAFEYWTKTLNLDPATANSPIIRVVKDESKTNTNASAFSVTNTTATPGFGNQNMEKNNTYIRLLENGVGANRTDNIDGRIVFEPGSASPWAYNTDRITQLMPADFALERTAIHEIGHLIGMSDTNQPHAQFYDATNNTFTGPNAQAVFGAPIPAGVDGDGNNDPAHTLLEYHSLTRARPFEQSFRNIPYFSPAELALIRDMGYTGLNLNDHFGTAIYQAGTNTPQTLGNYGSTMDYAVGLFLQADQHNIIVDGDWNISGFAGAGVRIAGRETDVNGSTITVGPGSSIDVSGDFGVGILASSGAGNTIIHRGEIYAGGNGGVGMLFDFGPPLTFSTRNQVTSGNYGDYLVDRVDISGRISAEQDAIRISDTAAVREFNIMQGAILFGDIVSNAMTSDVLDRPVITFGRLANTDGSASNSADANFRFFYTGNIEGTTLMDANFVGGRSHESGAHLTGKIEFQDVTVGTQGRVTANGAEFSVQGDVNSQGQVTVGVNPGNSRQGMLRVGRDFNNQSGAMLENVSSSGITVGRNLENQATAIIDNSGKLVVNGQTVNRGEIYNNLNGQLLANQTLTNQSNAIIGNVGLVLARDDIRNNGDLLNQAMLITGTMLVNEVDGHLVNNGQAAVGTNFVNRGTTVNSGVLKSVEGMSNAFEAVMTNNAQVEAGTSFTNTGTLNNNGNLFANTVFNNFPDGVVMNNGNVTVTNGDVNLSFESQFVNNGGQLNAQAGNIDIRGELTSRHGFVNASGVITVYDEGRFQGTPLVTATLVDNQTGGTMAAGNSIGTMTIDADYQTSGTVEYEITAQNVPQDSDLIHVINGHTATINNNTPSYAQRGTFEFTADAGTYDIARRYTILATQNDGDLVVVQSPVTTDNLADQRLILRSDKDLDALYTADARLYYGYIGRDVPFAQIGQTANQVAVGELFDAIKLIDDGTALGDEIQWIRDTLDLIVDEADVRSAMNQISGSFYGSVSPMAIQLMHANQARMVANMRGNNSVCAYDTETTGPMGLYGSVTGFGTGGHVGTDGNAEGYSFGGGGTQAIVGYGSGEAQIGGYYTYTGGSLRGTGRSGLEMHEFGGFFHHKSDGNYLLMTAGGGYAGFDVSRTISFGNTDIQNPIVQQYQNDLSVGLANINAEVGKEFLLDSMLLRPFLGMGYAYVGGDQFVENGGSLALTGQMNSLNSFRSTLGSDVSFCLGNDTTLDVRAAWMHEFEKDRAGTVVSGFSNGAGGTFVVRGVDMGSDFALLGANISREFAEGSVRVFGGYDLIFDGQQALNTGSGGVEFLW